MRKMRGYVAQPGPRSDSAVGRGYPASRARGKCHVHGPDPPNSISTLLPLNWINENNGRPGAEDGLLYV